MVRGRRYVSRLTTKRGKYGKRKVMAFLVLSSGGKERWYSTRELCLRSGLSYRSLGRVLSQWGKWGYIERQLAYAEARGFYECRLLAKGSSWLRIAKASLPNYSRFKAELVSWQSLVKPHYGVCMAMGFTEFEQALCSLLAAVREPSPG